MSKGVPLGVLADSVTEWRRRCAPAIEFLPSEQRAAREAEDAARYHAILRANLDDRDWLSAKRRLTRAVDLKELGDIRF